MTSQRGITKPMERSIVTPKILLIQLRQLGDILLSTPVIRACKTKWPNCHVTFLSHSMGKLILDHNPLLDQHDTLPQGGLVDSMIFLRHLQASRYDLVFDFMGNPRSAICTLATAAPKRVGFRSGRFWAYNSLVARVSGKDYIVKEKFRMLAAAGIDAIDERLMLPWNEEHLKVVQAYEKTTPQFISPSARILLSPTHRRLDRRWPDQNWSELADQLVDKFGAAVIWAWGPGEEEEVESIRRQCLRPTYKAPKTSFRELAALTAQCDLFIGNSNGPSHVAVAVNTPSIQLHGPTDAPSWCPMTSRHLAVAAATMRCVKVEDVVSAVNRVWPTVMNELNLRGQIKCSRDVEMLRPN